MSSVQPTGFAPTPNASVVSHKKLTKDVVDVLTPMPKETGNKEVDDLNKLLTEQKREKRTEFVNKILTPRVESYQANKLDTYM